MINKIIRNENLVVNNDLETIDGCEMEFAIIFDMDEERMFYLNNTSYEILKIAESQTSITEIIEYFEKHYSIAADDVESINQAVLDMLEKNIILSIYN